MNVRLLFALLPAFFLTCCGMVTVKQIAGDRVPEGFATDLCKGSWRGPDGTVAVFKLQDEAKGIVEVRTLEAGGQESRTHLALRTLGERMVATAWEKGQEKGVEPAPFLRVALSHDHIAFFLPNDETMKDAVKKGLIAGEIHDDRAPGAAGEVRRAQKAESVVLEKFGLAEAEKLGGVLRCFDPDPATVLIREVEPRPSTKSEKSGGKKK